MTAPPKPVSLAIGAFALGLAYVGCVPIWVGLAMIGWGDWRNLPPPFDRPKKIGV